MKTPDVKIDIFTDASFGRIVFLRIPYRTLARSCSGSLFAAQIASAPRCSLAWEIFASSLAGLFIVASLELQWYS